MTVSRRKFIRNSSLAVSGAFLTGNRLFTPYSSELVGLQLYSVRDVIFKDPAGILKQLSGMGYKYVEHANYTDRKFYGYSSKDFKKLLDDLGLKMPSGHTVLNEQHWDESKKDFTDLWKYTVEDAAIAGQSYVISPSMAGRYRKSYDAFMQLMEIFNKSGELCKKSGMKFGYHNHDFEFSEKLNNETLYELILAKTDPDLVIQQLDTGNLCNGGAKAIDIVVRHPGRFQSLHVKDEIPVKGNGERYESCVLGKGIADVKKVLDLVRKNTKHVHYIIEQEAYQGAPSMDCVKEDLAVMKKWGY